MPTIVRGDESFDVLERLAALPLRDVVVFPYMVIPLLVGRQGSLAAVEKAVAGDRWIFLVAQRDGEVQEPHAANLYRTGVVGRVLQVSRLANGTTKVLLEGVGRARATRYTPGGALLRATITAEPFRADPTATDDAMTRRVATLFEEYVGLHRRLPPEVLSLVQGSESRERLAYAVAAHLQVRHTVRQNLLESPSFASLTERLAAVLTSEIEILRLERKIENDVRGSLFQNQREFYLQEQLKAIHRELGQEDTDDFDELQSAISAKGLPDHARERAERELRKLRRTPPLSPESTVGRNYLDWLIGLPWTDRTDDLLDVTRAQTVLDEDHFGLQDVKDRILDYIAVLALVGKLEGPILCLVGPPGVGKTSLGRSIARATGREFVRQSLGGVRDEAEIRGHRRTYIGSLPGKIVSNIKKAGTSNPLFLLDEIDKLGQDFRGDPSSALLEVLDPEQNNKFQDHYLELDYDLSDVMFVTTANSLDMPQPLLDRMEIIRLEGYTEDEKVEIAKRHLIPKQMEAHGLKENEVEITDEGLRGILRFYTREAGVRTLERELAKIARKALRQILEGKYESVIVTLENLNTFLGVRRFRYGVGEEEDQVGAVTGLAWTEVGGELLTIEAVTVPGKGQIKTTGKLGEVMQESIQAAMSFVKARAPAYGVKPSIFARKDIHVHLPEGAVPKDGPSAGIGMVTAMISTLSGVAVRRDVAMTGEVTLRGRVLPIGGLKEKLLAALRGGIRTVLIPSENEKDLAEIPASVKEALEIIPVEHVDEVLSRALVDQLQAIEWTDADEHAAEPPVHGQSPETGLPIRH